MASVGVERSRRVHAGLRPASGATFGYYAEDDGVEGDLLAERPPSALFNDRLFGEPTAARRAPQPPRMDLRMSCGTPPPPLDEEMPPVSPFFARIRPSDIEEARATVRRASISRRRRNTLAAAEQQRSTWCASATATDPVFASLRPAPSAATPVRASLAGALAGWSAADLPGTQPRVRTKLADPCCSSSDDDWLWNQEPPISPLFAEEHRRLAAEKLKRTLAASNSPPASPICDQLAKSTTRRLYQVDVHSLFSTPLAPVADRHPRVTVKELVGTCRQPVDPRDPAVRHALRRHPLVLALGAPPPNQPATGRSPTRMRLPSPLRRGPTGAAPATLSFTVCADDASARDRPARAVDVDAMASAYLPHVHAMLWTSAAAAAGAGGPRASSESSVSTLVAPAAGGPRPHGCSEAPPKPPPRRSDVGVPPMRVDSRQLRASASVANLRAAYADRDVHAAMPLSAGYARRSTLATRGVMAPSAMLLALQPVAPPAAARPGGVQRRNSAMELGGGGGGGSRPPPPPPPASARRLQPLHASLTPRSSGSLLLLPLGERAVAGPGELLALQRGAVSGLRTPTSLVTGAPHHRPAAGLAGTARGRLQHTGGEAVQAPAAPPMRSASLEIPATQGPGSSGRTLVISSRTPGHYGQALPQGLLRKPPVNPSTGFGLRRRGITTTAMTPTASSRASLGSGRPSLSRPPPIPVSATAFVSQPSSYSTLPLPSTVPRRAVAMRRPDVRGVFGVNSECQLPRPKMPTSAGPVGLYRSVKSALPMFRASKPA
ncbi:hypothetical protein H4R26_002505 [Coemansia thaxteri]|uniref:Uncharacterized protein n=1 Tax=Coemansia thaxteri TaxID=2663907 RepID=A0A9W8EFX4_9FUNG|nr:hypothetical protein H4R26_002505 [Coemansia thaxteri]